MIELKQVTKEYGRATVLKNITLTLEEPASTACWAATALARPPFAALWWTPGSGRRGWRKRLWSTSCGAENPRVKQEEARLEPGDGRAEALLLACGFRLAEENTHGALYVPL